jgi:hypothetical protein
MAKYYVVVDREDPGSEHDSLEEAMEVLRALRAKYGRLPDARIISDDLRSEDENGAFRRKYPEIKL